MRNHSKNDKEKTKQALRSKASKKPPTYDAHSAVLKKIKDMATNDTPMECTTIDSTSASTTAASPALECIILDSGSKKSYIDLTESKAAATSESYSRISVIRTVGAQSPPAPNRDQFEFYQEKPVDFSPKHKYKTECGGKNITPSNQYTTIAV